MSVMFFPYLDFVVSVFLFFLFLRGVKKQGAKSAKTLFFFRNTTNVFELLGFWL